MRNFFRCRHWSFLLKFETTVGGDIPRLRTPKYRVFKCRYKCRCGATVERNQKFKRERK